MFLVHAENDGLLEAVTAFLQKLRHLTGNELGAVIKDDDAVEILGVVDAVLNLLTIAVERAFFWPVSLNVAVNMDFHHLIGRQEAVADALLEGVGEYGIAEIGNVGDVFCLLRGGGQADLCGAREVFQDFAPGRVLGGAAAMAFVNHDQVEEAGGEFAE